MSSTKSYWGGSKVVGGSIRRLEAKSFSDLVSRYFNVPHPLGCTREYFHAQPKTKKEAKEKGSPDCQDALKDGPYIMAVAFPEGTTFREDANASHLVLACLDIDDPDLARPFVESPETLIDALWPFNFVAYLTASATEANPKVRIIAPVEDSDVGEHKKLVKFLARLAGLPRKWSGHRESNVLSQPMFRPIRFEDDVENYSPVLSSRTSGREIQLIDVPEDVEEEVREEYAYRGETDEEADLLHLPLYGLTPADIQDALFSIDPDCDYKTWTEVGCALRHQFRDEESAEEAFYLYDEWSRRGDKFCEGDTLAKWKSFRPDPKGKVPVTLRSLFKYAQDAGWKPAPLAAKLRESFDEWLLGCSDAEALMQEGPQRIAAMPFRNGITEDSMKAALHKAIRGMGHKVGLPAVSKEVAKARVMERRKEDDGNLPNWLRPWCFIIPRDCFHNVINGVQTTPEGFNRTFMIELMPGEKDEDAAKSGRPSIMPSDFALNIKGTLVRKVHGVVYDPRWQGAEPYFEKNNLTYVNTYLPNSVPALDEKNSTKAGKMLDRHLENLIAEPEYRTLVKSWMAFIVQNPGIKIRWAPLIQSAQGAGKSILLHILGAAIGAVNVKLVNPGAMKSDFNDWSHGAQVIGIEEVRVRGKDRPEIMNKLKDILTNDRIALNRKNRDVETVDNVANFIAFTNYRDAAHLDEDDRRYFVIHSKVQSKAEVMRLAESKLNGVPYFDMLAKLLKSGGAVRHHLLNYEISSSFDPNGAAPVTKYWKQMVRESKHSMQLAIEDLIADGSSPFIGHDVILLDDIKSRTAQHAKYETSCTHYLYQLGFHPWEDGRKLALNGNDPSEVWVHAEHFDPDLGTPEQILRARYDKAPEESI